MCTSTPHPRITNNSKSSGDGMRSKLLLLARQFANKPTCASSCRLVNLQSRRGLDVGLVVNSPINHLAVSQVADWSTSRLDNLWTGLFAD